MFHQGDLQSGIALAVQESKSVVCFVHDDSEESTLWEDEWLQGHNIPQSLEQNAVCLRIVAGSKEAGFLSAFYPVTTTPAIVVIYQGKAEDQLLSGISRNDFTLRLLRAINRSIPRPQASSSQASPEVNAQTPSPPQQTNPRLQALLEERRVRLEADQKAKEEAERERIKAINARRKEQSESSSSGKKTAEQTHAQQVARQKREARQERERILKQLEQDKLDRQDRAARRKAELAEQRQQLPEPALAVPAPTIQGRKACILQVRLLDGSTIRSNFFPEATLRKDVRPFIDSKRTGDKEPYTLRQILTPAPSRAFTEADENCGLRELGLSPSASLVLVPASNVSNAYPTNPAGLIQQSFAIILQFFAGLLQTIMTFLRPAAPPERMADPGAITTSVAASTAVEGTENRKPRIRTLGEQQDGRDDQTLYNGNTLNFEPRKDEDGNEQ